VPQPPIVSYAQNREDVVLWRALGHIPDGRYVEVGANHPREDSVSFTFYQHGWSGLTVEPVQQFADLHRALRPRDVLVQAAITNDDVASVTLHSIPDTGLSTLVDSVSDQHAGAGIQHVDITVPAARLDVLLEDNGWDGRQIHFLLIDVEGAERSVLESVDLARWAPWVLVIEATAPNSTAPTHQEWEHLVVAAGYEFCLFDGLSRFYVHPAHAEELRAVLSYPACILDGYTTHQLVELAQQRDELVADVDTFTTQIVHWRTVALRAWAQTEAMRVSHADSAELSATRGALLRAEDEIVAIRQTVSWRLTRPVRGARQVLARIRRGQ
jgi:FkbM family methyltransferase